MIKVGIVIPARNEAATIGTVIAGIKKLVDQVVVVDDASHDQTADTAKLRQVNLIKNQVQLGYAKSIERGMRYLFNQPDIDYVITMDADSQHLARDVRQMLNVLNRHQPHLVIGKRDRHNRFMEQVVGWYTKKTFGISDPFCGLKAYSRKIFSRYGQVEGNYTVACETFLKAIRDGFSYFELPIHSPKRVDKPRFGSQLSGNYKELIALLNIVRYI